MNNRTEQGPPSGSRLKVLTAAALGTDKGATSAKDQARQAKAKLKAAKKQLREAKNLYKTAKKRARKAVKEAKHARKALQRQLDRVAKTKKSKTKRAAASKAPIAVARTTPVESKPERTELSGNSG